MRSPRPMPDLPGAFVEGRGTTFRIWAPEAHEVAVRIFADPERATETVALCRSGAWFEDTLAHVGAGSLYKLVVDGRELPDPYARYLPFGVDGPAEVVRTAKVSQRVAGLAGHGRMVIYEIHVGAFTREGTYEAAAERLDELAELGVTTLELMPLAAFPGLRGWGYDGVAHFAPFAPYGRPEDLRAFIKKAHDLGLGVLLDVVYNHFGPRGNYLREFDKKYFSDAHGNPWGSAPDFTYPPMRAYVLANARMWFDEYGFDGLRLDATHAIHDPSSRDIVRELTDLAASYEHGKHIIAEDERNDPAIVTQGKVDAVWADDFHHQMRVLLTGERDGYYAAYEPTVEALARTIERGWIYEGQLYPPWGRERGKRADDLDAGAFVYCVENHDQIGNRAFGTRLDRDTSVDALRAATIVLLFLPMTPLLFMGQEWAASSPFLYFTDHDSEYGPAITKGRREEFMKFEAYRDEAQGGRIPDPQDLDTFVQSKLEWEEATREPHDSIRNAVRTMLRLRRDDAVLGAVGSRAGLRAYAREGLLCVERAGGRGRRVLLANLSPRPVVADAGALGEALLQVGRWAESEIGPFAARVLEA